MSAHAWAIRPNGLVSHRGNGAMDGLLAVLRGAWEVVAFAYRLRTGHGVGRRRGRIGSVPRTRTQAD